MKPKKLPFKKFKEIYSKVPRIVVELVIKTKKGIVLSKRDIEPYKGMWHLPGGTVLFGEQLNQTVSRVASEETGLKLKIEKIIDIIEHTSPNMHEHAISIVYLCKPISGTLRGSEQGRAIEYFGRIPSPVIEKHKLFLLKNSFLK